ncbi:MAG: indole-3-glycerol phosphate synthase TrpC [Pseudanabaenaceae cyanobacterium bins.68]|nr:indole-3-glycerol phosphate synthase TrpC [Pseudanabaenaceae cyanobacterium bins.68]
MQSNILEQIVRHKQVEIQSLPQVQTLEPSTRDFGAALTHSSYQPALIAELKRASPSKGVIRADFDPEAIARDYAQGGAACLSVLTDHKFFGGSFANLERVRRQVDLPLLCKEFIISPIQIRYARSCGADAVLLIKAILSDRDLVDLAQEIYHLNMTALIEVHSQAELDQLLGLQAHLIPAQTLFGINNRNLETFTVDLQVTSNLLTGLSARDRAQWRWISESGIYTGADVAQVKALGVTGILVGESLLRQPDLSSAITKLYTA